MHNKLAYICCLSVVLQVSDIPCQAKVRNFHDIIFANKNISSSKVTMNTLQVGNKTTRMTKGEQLPYYN